MKKLSKREIKGQLFRIGNLSWLLDSAQKDLYDMFHNSEHRKQVWLLSRRCLAEGNLIKTPQGLMAIETLKPGDEVYGVQLDGSVLIANVNDVYKNGPKEVVDLCTGSRVLETCTLDHVWLTQNTYDMSLIERRTSDLKKTTPIVRRWVDIDSIDDGVTEPHAYAIGALLGDGCSRQNVENNSQQIYISSENDNIPREVARILGCKYFKNSLKNFTWCLSHGEKNIGSNKLRYSKVECNYYDKWIKGRYAHEKIADLEVIKAWDAKSQLAFLAGILDTDGSIMQTKDDHCLVLAISMQAKSVVEACQYIIHNLFQHKCTLRIDQRDKYKNGPCYCISIKNNLIVPKILKELDIYLQTPRKKWSDEYLKLNINNQNVERVGVKIKNPRIMNTYDISIDNGTNLYLTANGLTTHNSGKTYSLTVLSMEMCFKTPYTIVKYVAPTEKQVRNYIRPIVRQILEDCPEDIKPVYKEKESILFFPNGSELHFAGSDGGHAEKLRGAAAHLCVVDEAGLCDDLKNIITSILLPTTLTTKGKILLAGTPPRTLDHDFIDIIATADAGGYLIKRDVYSNPRLTREDIDDMIKEMGGIKSEEVRRELFCEIIKDPTISVLPEFNEELKQKIVKKWPQPPFFDTYVSMDVGFKDLTAVLFAYYDFRNNKIVIQDEIQRFGNELQLAKLTADINKKEIELWYDERTAETKRPKQRVSDIDYIVMSEISIASNRLIQFVPARKDDKLASINDLRTRLAREQIIIDPKCVNLIRHLENVRWYSLTTKDKFARTEADGHYDFIDALLYLVRSIPTHQNPFPSNYQMDMPNIHINNPEKFYKEDKNHILRKIFNMKPR